MLALTSTAGAAAGSSAEKARQALTALQSGASPAEKALACKTLAVYGSPDAIPALAPLLTDPHLASWARIALEAIPGPAADEALRAAMGKTEGILLVGVINSIGVRRDAAAVPTLAGKLTDADADVAAAAAIALGRIGGEPAAAALEPLLTTAPAATRSAVAQGCILCAEHLLASGNSAAAMKLYDTVRRADLPKQRVLEGLRGAILARQADGLPLLLEALRSPDRGEWGIGLRTARELPGRAVTEALAAELEKTAPVRQEPLLLALADRSDDAVLPAVFAAARNGAAALRLAAIGVMQRVGNVACVPVLLEILAKNEPQLTAAAKTALSNLPGKEVDEQICVRLPQVTGDARRALVDLAGQRRATAAVPELIKAAADADPATRIAATKALGETVAVGEFGALTDLLAKAKSAEDAEAAEGALESAWTRLPEKEVCADKLLAGLAGSPPPTRCSLLRVFGTVSTAKTLTAVRAALEDGDATVRDTAYRVLADWPDAAALPALAEVFRTTQNDTYHFLALRGSVRLLGLGNQPVSQTVSTFRELLAGAKNADDRKMVLSGLASVPAPAALKLTEPLLADAQVRPEAELASLGIAAGIAGSDPADAEAVAKRLQVESQNARTRDRAAQVLQQIQKSEGFTTAWQVSGPYTEPASGSTLFNTAFPPEQADGRAAWRSLSADTEAGKPWMLDLLAALGGEHRAGYARTWIHSDKTQAARIEFGTDDGHKLWLNGQLVHQADRGGAAVPGDFKVEVTLRQGWNALLLKVTQDTGPWEFCLRVRAPGGGKLEGLRTQATPPKS